MEVSGLFCLLLLVIAFLYSCVGHGGASGYIALMTLFEFSPAFIKPAALVLNIIVSFMAFVQFYKAGYFDWKIFYPFAIASVPAAFAGGLLTVDENVFKQLLGILLIFPVLNLMGAFNFDENKPVRRYSTPLAMAAGGIIGFMSGLIGIGGGILLSPFLLLMRWADMKKTAAVSALFIFVNSLAGLFGYSLDGFVPGPSIGLMIAVTLAGGWVGAYAGSFRFPTLVLKRILAVVLLIAAAKLVMV